jgi:transcriptional regulator with XRE-family HTH domain
MTISVALELGKQVLCVDMVSLGDWVRTLRMAAGISLNEMAKELSVSSGYLSNLETGKTDHISIETLAKATKVLQSAHCPLCGSFMRDSPVADDSELTRRVNRIHQRLLDAITQDPERLKHQLHLMEFGYLG